MSAPHNATLTARFDTKNIHLVCFSKAVTIQEAGVYLWNTPQVQKVLKGDPTEPSRMGRQHQFLIGRDPVLFYTLKPADLKTDFLRRMSTTPMGDGDGPALLMSKGPTELPQWVPPDIKQRVKAGNVVNGVSRFPGVKPWGDVVLWVSKGFYTDVQVYQEYPENYDYYLRVARNDAHKARLLHQVYTQYNRDMRQLVEVKKLSPERARDEIRTINEAVFKQIIEASANILSTGAAISAIGGAVSSSAEQVVGTAERTKFAAPKPQSGLAQQVKVGEDEYRAALSRVFPGHQLDDLARVVDDIGQRAAKRVADNPKFVKALVEEDWKTAGNLFHDAAKQEARLVDPAMLPPGWTITAEETIKSGKNGSRLDVFLRGPGGKRVEIDWKTSVISGLSSRVKDQMKKHLGHIVLHTGGTVVTQESRSWIDYVRAYFPAYEW